MIIIFCITTVFFVIYKHSKKNYLEYFPLKIEEKLLLNLHLTILRIFERTPRAQCYNTFYGRNLQISLIS